MKLQSPDTNKLIRSAIIVVVAIGFLLGLQYLFPHFEWSTTEAIILAGVGTWLTNTLKEALGL